MSELAQVKRIVHFADFEHARGVLAEALYIMRRDFDAKLTADQRAMVLDLSGVTGEVRLSKGRQYDVAAFKPEFDEVWRVTDEASKALVDAQFVAASFKHALNGMRVTFGF